MIVVFGEKLNLFIQYDADYDITFPLSLVDFIFDKLRVYSLVLKIDPDI